jgi:4-amino-4-deoxy-L-arabinose transferase-like glycosyltransferase
VPRTLSRGLLAPTLVTLGIRVALAAALPVAPVWDGEIYARAADELARGEGYTRHAIDPAQGAEPTAFYPVGLPAALAPLRWVAGGRGLDLAAQILFGTLLVPVAGMLGRRAGGARVGRASAWIVALWPGGILLSLSWMSEPLFSLVVACAVLALVSTRRARRPRGVVLAAVLLGLAAHVRPTALPVLAVLVAGVAWTERRRASHVLRHVVLAALVALAVLAPWSVRNVLALGRPALVSTNGGSNLLLGTLGEGRYGPIPPELDCSAARTEPERDGCRTEQALVRIADAPLDHAARALLKLSHTFGHESGPAEAWAAAIDAGPRTRQSARLWALGLSRIAWLGLLASALAGAALALARGLRAVDAALLAPPLAIALLHAAVLGGDRYHAPAVATMAVLSAEALSALSRLVRARRGSD